MTEEEWLAARNPEPMLAGRANDRKLRLFVVACVQNVLPSEPDDGMIAALELAEQFADGAATRRALNRARKGLRDLQPERARRWPLLYSEHIRSLPAWHATREAMTQASAAAVLCAWSTVREPSLIGGRFCTRTFPSRELGWQADLVRCVYGNPFRPVAVEPGWRTPAVVELARGIYADRAWDRLPILADALDDAGCTHPDVIGHLRGPGPHARGCWVVDAVLGKV